MDQRSPAAKQSSSLKPNKPKKGIAIASLIFGIIALGLIWTSFLDLFLCALAILFAIVAIVKKQSKALSIFGLVLGVLALVGSILVWTFYGFRIINKIFNIVPEETNDKKTTEIRPQTSKEGESCKENLNGPNCIKGSREYWEAFCEINPSHVQCASETIDVSWVKQYLQDELKKSEEGDDTELPNDLVKAMEEAVYCLNDVGFAVKSADGFAKIQDSLISGTGKYTEKQLVDGEECLEDFLDALDDLEN